MMGGWFRKVSYFQSMLTGVNMCVCVCVKFHLDNSVYCGASIFSIPKFFLCTFKTECNSRPNFLHLAFCNSPLNKNINAISENAIILGAWPILHFLLTGFIYDGLSKFLASFNHEKNDLQEMGCKSVKIRVQKYARQQKRALVWPFPVFDHSDDHTD